MKSFLITTGLLLLSCSFIFGQDSATKPNIYLLPGLGTDYRVFKNVEFDTSFNTCHIDYVTPTPEDSFPSYARTLAKQVDTSKPYVLIGCSLGGMIATEMAHFMDPERVIIIASAKGRNELPPRYKFQRAVPLHKLVGGKTIKTSTLILQPIVEPDRNKEKETFVSMLKGKSPILMWRTMAMILNWERDTVTADIVHIHGDNDKTVPLRNVSCDYVIPNGSHVMMLTRSKEIGIIINQELLDVKQKLGKGK